MHDEANYGSRESYSVVNFNSFKEQQTDRDTAIPSSLTTDRLERNSQVTKLIEAEQEVIIEDDEHLASEAIKDEEDDAP